MSERYKIQLPRGFEETEEYFYNPEEADTYTLEEILKISTTKEDPWLVNPITISASPNQTASLLWDYEEDPEILLRRDLEDYEEEDYEEEDDIEEEREPNKWEILSDKTDNWRWTPNYEEECSYKKNHIDIFMELDDKMRRLNIQAPYATRQSWRNCVTPIWQSKEDLLEMRSYRAEARRRTEESKKLFENGEIEKPLVYHVDHIIPLTPKKIRGQGPTISGIHAASNLQILERGENIRKRNNLTGEPLRDKHGRSRVLSDRILVEKPKNWKAYEVIFEV